MAKKEQTMSKKIIVGLSLLMCWYITPSYAADISLAPQVQTANNNTVGATAYSTTGNDTLSSASGVFRATVNNSGWTPGTASYANARSFYSLSHNTTLQGAPYFYFTATAYGGISPVTFDANAFAKGVEFDGGSTTISGASVITATAQGGIGNQAGAMAYGIYNSGSTTEFVGDTQMDISAKAGTGNTSTRTEAYGVNNVSGQTKITGNAVLNVNAIAGNGPDNQSDVYAHAIQINAGSVEITGTADITAVASNGGLNNTTYVTTEGINAVGGTVTIGGNTSINSQATAQIGKAAYAYGIYNMGANVNINNDIKITSTARAHRDAGITAFTSGVYNTSGTTNLTGNVDISASATEGGSIGAYTLRADGGTINVNTTLGNLQTVKLSGDVRAYNTGVVNLVLNDRESYLRGNVRGLVNFKVANGAQWQPIYDNRNGSFNATSLDSNYVSATNSIAALNLADSGVVDLTWDDSHRTTARTMAITNLTGNGGTLKLNTDVLNNSTGDLVNVTTVTGTPTLQAAITYDPVVVNGTGYYTATTNYKPIVATGAILTGVQTESGAYSLLPSFENDILVGLQVGVSSNTKAAASAALEQTLLMQVATNHLQKRLGELRTEKNKETGVWGRLYTGEVSNSKYSKVESDYNGIQFGYDKNIAINKDERKYFGYAVNYTDSNDTFAHGTGESRAYDVAVYQTWLGAKGHYYDIIAKVGRLDSNYQVTDLSNNSSKASYKTWTQSISAEYGYRKQLGASWYLEPQAELSVGHIQSVNYVNSAGMRVHQAGIERVIGRLGLNLGKKLTNGTNFYATLSGLREFACRENIKADSIKYSQDMSGNWGELLLGVTGKINDNSEGYLNVEKLFGGDVSSNWQINIGCRYSF